MSDDTVNLRPSVDYGFVTSPKNDDGNYAAMNGGGISIDVQKDIVPFIFGRLRLGFNYSLGQINNKTGSGLRRLADVTMTSGFVQPMLGLKYKINRALALEVAAGYGLGLSSVNVDKTDAGSTLYPKVCPNLAAILSDPEKLDCYIDGVDISAVRHGTLEVGVNASGFIGAVAGEYMFVHGDELMMPKNLFRVGARIGFEL